MNQHEIERAIEYTENRITTCENVKRIKRLHNMPDFDTSLDIHKTILQALKEQNRLNQGCEYCNNAKLNNVTAIYESGVSEKQEIESKFCGNCGKGLD